MSDFRMSFIKSIETSLALVLPPEQIQLVSGTITRILNDYEITKRCTELAPVDSENVILVRRYLACLLVDGKSKKTIYQYGRHLARLSEELRKDYTKMSAYDIRYYLAIQKERGISNRSVENIRAVLSAFFQWLAAEDLIPKNPMASIKPIKYTDEVRLPFSDVEIDAMRSACRTTKERALIEVLLASGIRVSELSEMDVADVDMTGMTVHVRHGKGGKERMTYLTPVASKHLRAYLRTRKETDAEALFCSKNHKRLGPEGIRYLLKTVARRAGTVNCHPHRFRRTFATGLAARGMEVQEIQRLLGHSNISTTLEYIAVNDDQVRASYKKYSA